MKKDQFNKNPNLNLREFNESSDFTKVDDIERNDLWVIRTDFLKSSNSEQGMKWFKGSRNRNIRSSINDLAA